MTTQSVEPAPASTPAHRTPAGRRNVVASTGQASLWFLRQVMPHKSAYNTAVRYRLEGALDARALVDAFREISRRHESCRTTFLAADGVVTQVIHDAMAADVTVVDARSAPDPQAEADRVERDVAAAPFDLASGPLVRLCVIRIGAHQHSLVLVMDHIVADGMSLGVIWRELEALYRALRAGEPSPLPPPAKQYLECVEAQNKWLASAPFDKQVEFWKKHLAGAAPCDLPTDHPRPPVKSYRGDMTRTRVPRELVARLEAMTAREGVSLFTSLLTALEVLLARYSGQRDITVLVPVACRSRFAAESVIGYFANILVLRSDVDSELPVRALLKSVSAEVLSGLMRQDVPFERVVQATRPERSLGHDPLSSVGLSFLPAGGSRLDLPGVSATYGELSNGGSKFDLHLFVAEVGGELTVTTEFSTDLFDRATVDRLNEHYLVLLEAMADDPGAPVHALPLMRRWEHDRVLREWNATERDYHEPRMIHEIFEAQVDATPDAVALEFEGHTVTYRELDRRANRLARALRARGVGPDVLVGVCMLRSIELCVALYATLKAGGAYVPIDPEHPDLRRAQVLEDAHPRVVLTQPALRALFAAGDERVLTLGADGVVQTGDAASEAASALSDDRLERAGLNLDRLAYVIFTSGSTGRPKGAMNAHRGIQNRLLWMQRAFALTADDRVLQKTPFSFDVSVWEFFWPLMFGARLVVARPDGHRDPGYLAERIQASGVTVLHFVPSMLAAFLESPAASSCRSIRRVFASGEALPPPLCERFFDVLPHASLDNLYGPTEAAVDVTHWPCRPGAAVVPIGRPIDNTRMYVLDERRQPVPIGIRGELFIAGVQVGRGYLQRPELTEERFVADPFDDGKRMYRTGDVARWLPDGDLEYLGRTDFQVKLRGFRIELGEIETVLREIPGVADVVVVAREDVPGDKRLVAYVVADPGVTVEAMRAHARAKLPEYMVPSAFVRLDALPLTSSGKTDRKALPRPDLGEGALGSVGPRTPTEEIVARLWSDVLGVAAVGAEDDFFAIGGHSLLGMRVIARLHRAFGVELPVRTLFEARTVAQLARRIEAGRRDGRSVEPSAIVRVPRDRPLPLSFAQQRLWLLDRLEPGDTAYNLPTAWRLEGALDPAALEASLRAIVERHEALRTVFVEVDGEPRQIISDGTPLSLTLVDLSVILATEGVAELRSRASADAGRPFDLARGPLLRATLYRLADRDHLLLVSAHHIVSDGWSEGLLGLELSQLYGALSTGQPSPLAPLPIQPADFATWQRGWLTGAVLEAQLAYWRAKLAGAPASLDLPADRPRPPVQSTLGRTLPFELPAELRAALEALARKEGVTLFMVMLAAFQALLHRYTGQDDIVVGAPIAGRGRPEIEPLLGFFVGTLVLRAQLGPDMAFRDLLAQVRETTLDAYANQDVPFEKVVEALSPPRDLSRSPLFQVMLILQNAPASPPRLGPVSMRRAEVERETSKFDLTLQLLQDGSGLSGLIEYSTALFDEERIARMAGHLRVLLEAVVADPSAPIARLPLLTEAERRRVVVEWNDTARPIADVCLHETVEAQVDRTPDATAVVFGQERVTYAELERRANRLANHLRTLGVGPEVLVGLCVERSVDLVVAILGILKSGGAYVPLDPAYPSSRLAAILEDSKAAVVVTEERARGSLPTLEVPAVRLDADRAVIDAASEARPASGVRGHNLAYTLFTSGSTGRPKGVAIEHRSPVALLGWARDVYGPSDTQGTLFATSMCFDLSIFEMFVPLSTGGEVILAQNALELPSLPARDEVTLINTVPSAMSELLRAGVPSSVRTVNLAGEPLSNALAQQVYAVPTIARLLNLYGPTEDTTYSTFAEGRRETGLAPPIGRPLSNGTAYVLDRQRQPVPIGVPGEIYLGGAGLARGYLHRPDLTAERFVDNPFGPGRLYRTGDLGRFQPDGTLEYLGRIDHQVKVRGFRIELGEIESVLGSHPGVREVVVVAREDRQGDPRLVAYVTGPGLSVDELRARARSKLPDYMVPAAFVVLEALPLNPNGKVDRKALPPPGHVAPQVEDAAGPRDDVEAKLAAIFRNVLGLSAVGVRDSFFDLGGHSLLAVRLLAQIERVFGKALPLVTLFRARTVEQLAELIRTDASMGPPGFLLVPIQPKGPKRPLFLISRPNVNSLGYIALSRHLDPDRPVYSLQYDYPEEGELGRPYSDEEYAKWARSYIDTIRLIQPSGPYLLGGMCEGAQIAFWMTRQLEAAGERVALLAMLDAWPPENTVRPLLHKVYRYELSVRALATLSPRDRLRAVFRAIESRLGGGSRAARVAAHEAWVRRSAAEAGFVPPKVQAPITVLRVKRQAYWRPSDSHLGWRDRTRGGVEVHVVAGDHTTLLREPHVVKTGRVLDACLRRADGVGTDKPAP